MKTLRLTNSELVALVDDDDLERVNKYRWHLLEKKGYVQSYIDERNVFLHRFVLKLRVGDERKVDHINGERRDCRKDNLRIATVQQNSMNRRKPVGVFSSNYKGVTFKTNRWEAQIQIDGKGIYLGRYKSEIEAAAAYNERAKELFGDFALLNQLPEGGENGETPGD